VNERGDIISLHVLKGSGVDSVDSLIVHVIEAAAPFKSNADSMIGDTAQIIFDDNDVPKFDVSIYRPIETKFTIQQ